MPQQMGLMTRMCAEGTKAESPKWQQQGTIAKEPIIFLNGSWSLIYIVGLLVMGVSYKGGGVVVCAQALHLCMQVQTCRLQGVFFGGDGSLEALVDLWFTRREFWDIGAYSRVGGSVRCCNICLPQFSYERRGRDLRRPSTLLVSVAPFCLVSIMGWWTTLLCGLASVGYYRNLTLVVFAWVLGGDLNHVGEPQ